MPDPDIIASTAAYETWLAKQIPLVKEDLVQKHENMASDPFIFLRATFYRWAQRWPVICEEYLKLPAVLAVGDLHSENFGTWRDNEGRLVWGVNDFDEAYHLPFVYDLVRLATSASLAIEAGDLAIDAEHMCATIADGYREGLTSGGKPFVLQENYPELRAMALARLKDPIAYWKKLRKQSETGGAIPDAAKHVLKSLLPADIEPDFQIFHRKAGQGSLGRQRFVALVDYKGGHIAREIKALAPSACYFANQQAKGQIYYEEIMRGIRCGDPFLKIVSGWVGRRLAPDCSRIELTSLPKDRDEAVLLHAMGFEVANIHLSTPTVVPKIEKSLTEFKSGWLLKAAQAMKDDTLQDFHTWRKSWRKEA